MWSPSVVSSERDHGKSSLRNLLKSTMGYNNKTGVRCMVSGAWCNHDSDYVIGAHIIPCRVSQDKLAHLGLTSKDISGVRNGLFLACNVEKAFDSLQLSFAKSPNPLSDALVLKIWDDSCRDTPIWAGHKTLIGDLDGRDLILGSHNPFRRALSYHACQAYARNNIEGMSPPSPYGSPNVKLSQVASELSLMRARFDRDFSREVEDNEEETEEESFGGGEEVVGGPAEVVAAGEMGGRAKGRRGRRRRKGGRGGRGEGKGNV